MMDRGRPAEVLLVEDNPGDVELTIEALQDARILNRVTVARDGVEAMAVLNHEPGYENAARPDLIILDLNLPRKDGFQVLRETKEQPSLARIPVIILTTSQAERDVLRSYDLKANCFVSKPLDSEEFFTVIRSMGEFWLSIVKLPPDATIAAGA